MSVWNIPQRLCWLLVHDADADGYDDDVSEAEEDGDDDDVEHGDDDSDEDDDDDGCLCSACCLRLPSAAAFGLL